MNNKKWIKLFIFSSTSVLILVGVINYVIDPLSETNYNLFNIEKVVQTVRKNKLVLSKNIVHIDNLILGSSRSIQLNPKVISKYLGGTTFNFAVNSGLPEDYLGILRYLIRENKIPKNIILGLDFYILNDKIPPENNFLSEPELNFLNMPRSNNTFFSLNKFLLSVKNIYMVLAHKKAESTFDINGYLFHKKEDDLIHKNQYNFMEKIQEDSTNYMKGKYSRKTYDSLSNERIKYLLEFLKLTEKYDIKIISFLSPVHNYHYQKIMENKTLAKTLVEFKREIAKHFNYYDFMYPCEMNQINENFYDAVHIRSNYNDLIIDEILSNGVPQEQRVGILNTIKSVYCESKDNE